MAAAACGVGLALMSCQAQRVVFLWIVVLITAIGADSSVSGPHQSTPAETHSQTNQPVEERATTFLQNSRPQRVTQREGSVTVPPPERSPPLASPLPLSNATTFRHRVRILRQQGRVLLSP
uniref:Uncharacterized protein n=1 Tax=Knipowitschia caucasica TaxID=637954 RepID=A0AAV2JBF2_KNICA